MQAEGFVNGHIAPIDNDRGRIITLVCYRMPTNTLGDYFGTLQGYIYKKGSDPVCIKNVVVINRPTKSGALQLKGRSGADVQTDRNTVPTTDQVVAVLKLKTQADTAKITVNAAAIATNKPNNYGTFLNDAAIPKGRWYEPHSLSK